MIADRYTKAVLTIIAIELGWLALAHSASPVNAQVDATPVVITGIELRDGSQYLPVGVLGRPSGVPAAIARSFQPLGVDVRNSDPIRTSTTGTIDVRTVGAIRIDTTRPLKVENVGYTPARVPGE